VREVQHAGAGADGWVSDLLELWVFEVRVMSLSNWAPVPDVGTPKRR
jgi:hypothetical protein